MSSEPAESTDKASQPQARESEWYDKHYSVRDVDAAAAQTSEKALLKHLGPWYGAALPAMRSILKKEHRLIELGCGSGRMPAHLVREGLIPAENVYGVDQSKVAVERAGANIPGSHFTVGDLYNLTLPRNHFHVAMLMEVIEHFEVPEPALKQIFEVVAPDGYLFVSFPNYVHLPWLLVRILAEKLKRPNWIVLQPIDKIYTVRDVRRLLEGAGFKFERGIGANYGPPVLYPLEFPWMTRLLNKLGLWWTSFHPVLIFRKPK